MPNIELSLADLEKLVGKKLPRDVDALNDVLQYAKCEVDHLEKDALTLSVEDSNRSDLWCAEGVARELRGALGVESGLKEYRINASKFKITVDRNLKTIRPFIAAAVVKNVKLTDAIIRGLMQQQDKIDTTYGRGRRKSSIGLYNLDMLKWPLKYGTTAPNANAFVPLGFDVKLTPAQIIAQHPKGKEYGPILAGLSKYPLLTDSAGKVLSMPPVINSNDLGQVNTKTRNILVEVTGTDWSVVKNVLGIIASSLAERGGSIHQVSIDYPYAVDGKQKQTTPQLEGRKMRIESTAVNSWLGEHFPPAQLAKILTKGRYAATVKGTALDVTIPWYRTDVMHWVDVAEDIAIQHGYDNFVPIPPALPTVGALSDSERSTDRLREVCLGLGAQEIMNFTLTNPDASFSKMRVSPQQPVELANSVSEEYTILRTWLLPGLLKFLAANRTAEYPQIIFEIGDCVVPDNAAPERSKTVRKLAIAIIRDRANLTECKALVEALAKNIGLKYSIKPAKYPSFIESRTGELIVNGKSAGYFGEIHPAVLRNWGLELPVIAAEFEVSALGKSI